MKKITLTALLMAFVLSANAQVTISGKIGQYYDSTKTGNNTVTTIGAEPTSNIKIAAQEDLGGGLKANVVVDTRLFPNDPTTTDTQLGNRQSTVGLSNKLGSIDLGRSTHSLFNNYASNDPFGVLYGSIVEDVHSTQNKRFSNATFVNVTPIKGLAFEYDRQSAATGPDGISYGGSYTFANVTASYSTYTLGDDTSKSYGAYTTVGNLRVNAMYSEDTVNNVKYEGKTFGAAYPVTSVVTLKSSYGVRTGGAGEVKAYNVGLDYAFSKRTVGQVVYRNVDTPGASTDIKQVAVGMVHKF